MSKITIIEGNSNDKDNVRTIMVKGEKGEQGDLNHNDIIDNLTSTASDKVLSANQGKILKNLIDTNIISIENTENTINNEISARENNDTIIQGNIDTETSERLNAISNLQSQINALASGSPLVASSTAGMTDTSRVYVNTTDGKWYYYNGTNWEAGGTYQASEDSQSIDNLNSMISLIKSQNLFNKAEVVTGKYASNTVGNTLQEHENSSFSYIIIDLPYGSKVTVTGTSFYYYFINDDNIVKYFTGNPNLNVSPATITNNTADATKVVINFRQNTYPIDTYMIVEGENLPSTYISYFDPYVKLNYKQYYATLEDLEGYNKKENIYRVGASRQFTTLTSCLEYLQGDTTEKTIYIDPGDYDIFEEIGGSEFALSIESGTTWSEVSVIVPPNTKIIGLGKVILRFEPTSAEIGNIASTLLSPLNVAGTCHIENIEIIADNCRYCIHDETSGNSQYKGAKKTYKNVKCTKKSTGNLGYQQAYASGFDDNMIFEFDNCIFKSNRLPFSVHNRETSLAINSSKIYAKNCAFICGEDDTSSVRLGNINWRNEEIPVILNNCYLNKKVKIYPETEYGHQNYNLTMIGCSNVTVDITLKDGDVNTFTPEILTI